MNDEVDLTPDENIKRLEEVTERAGPYISTLATVLKDCYSQLKLEDDYLDALPYKTLEKLDKYLLDIDMMCFDIWHIVSSTHLKVGAVKSIRDVAKKVYEAGAVPLNIRKDEATTPMDKMIDAIAGSANAEQLLQLLKKRLENK